MKEKWQISESSILQGCSLLNNFAFPRAKYLSVAQSFMLRNKEVSYPDPNDFQEEYEKPTGAFTKSEDGRKRIFENYGTRKAEITGFYLGEEKKEVYEFLELTEESSEYKNFVDTQVDSVPLLQLDYNTFVDLLTLLAVEDSFEGRGEWVIAYLDTPRPFGDHQFLLYMEEDTVLAQIDTREGES